MLEHVVDPALIEEAADLIADARHVVALTGAGISKRQPRQCLRRCWRSIAS
jgi:hypothetical protein